MKWLQLDSDRAEVVGQPYERRDLLHANFIDLNVFAHRTIALRATRRVRRIDEPARRLGTHHPIHETLRAHLRSVRRCRLLPGHSSFRTSPIRPRSTRIERRYIAAISKNASRSDWSELRIAYFVYDFPALSQTFVLNEIRWFVQQRIRHQGLLRRRAGRVGRARLRNRATSRRRRSITGGVYSLRTNATSATVTSCIPGVTRFVWPACIEAGIHFTFMPHAVDIFHHDNRGRNRIARDRTTRALPESVRLWRSPSTLSARARCCSAQDRIRVSSRRRRRLRRATTSRRQSEAPLRGVVFARFIEKKGIRYLLDAAKLLAERPVSFDIYGYGPLESGLKQHARELALKNVVFRGPVSGKKELSDVYRDADFLVAPCIEADNGDMDGFPDRHPGGNRSRNSGRRDATLRDTRLSERRRRSDSGAPGRSAGLGRWGAPLARDVGCETYGDGGMRTQASSPHAWGLPRRFTDCSIHGPATRWI